jgi:hypothetical protein
MNPSNKINQTNTDIENLLIPHKSHTYHTNTYTNEYNKRFYCGLLFCVVVIGIIIYVYCID